MKHIVTLACGTVLAAGMLLSASAVEIDGGDCYCFSQEDFAPQESGLAGICITRLPEKRQGTVMLGSRVLRPGDVLTAQQVGEMTFAANHAQADCTAAIGYLPMFANGLAGEATMTLSIRGRENQAPIAEDCAFETYKNLEVTGQLKVRDPEGQEMTFTLTRQPKRGTIQIQPDGSFTYTPKKNKVGVDSFTFTATDPAGKISREATVTVSIIKPTDAKQYSDTVGKTCRFAAEWMKNTGIFVAERVGGNSCFQPGKDVSRGEFLTMLVGALEIPLNEAEVTGYTDDAPDWLKPYLVAAMRSGLTTGWPQADTFQASAPITGAEAAVMLQNALKLDVPEEAETAALEEAAPDWADSALKALSCSGINLSANENLTRSQAARILYQAAKLSPTAPGTRLRNVVQ